MPAMTTLNEPPPSYECVMALDEVISRKRKNLYTFKGYHHHPGHAVKNFMGNGNEELMPTPTTPQVSLDETNCDIRSPSSATSLCNCNYAINHQSVTTNLCANCSNVIDNAEDANNNIVITCPIALITGSNLAQDNCPLNDTNYSSPPTTAVTFTTTINIDSLSDQLNNNNDYNGNSNQLDSIASPSTSTSIQCISCSVPMSDERQKSQRDIGEEEDDDELDGNGNCRRLQNMSLDTIHRNGLIRLDMSQIIDQTGLPTYEAALKLKSSGYV